MRIGFNCQGTFYATTGECILLQDYDEVNSPFSYPRMYKMTSSSIKASSFFYPHQNESGYWCQGENARLASLTTAFRLLLKMQILEKLLQKKLSLFAQSLLDWILGKNPMNICMLKGVGYHNPPEFDSFHESVKGGICNGITSGLWDEVASLFYPRMIQIMRGVGANSGYHIVLGFYSQFVADFGYNKDNKGLI